jgi:hypothetical protein
LAPRSLIDFKSSAMAAVRGLAPRLPFAVDADANGVGFHVAFADHEHGVHFHLLGTLDFADRLATDVEADLVCKDRNTPAFNAKRSTITLSRLPRLTDAI